MDIASLCALRVVFGLVMVWEACRYLEKGWVQRYWVEPDFFFTYQGFGWVEPWGGDGMVVHFVVLGLLGLCIAAGFAYRLSAALFFVGWTYVFLLDKSWYLNHAYLIGLVAFLMIFVPAHRAFSVDALLRPRLAGASVPAAYLWLLRGQIGLVYFFGGVAKLNGDWLRAQPIGDWIAARDDTPLIGGLFTHEAAGYGFAYGGLLLDLLIVPLLLWRRTRAFAFAFAVGFHLLNDQLFQIGVFPWLMIGATTLFLAPDWPRRFWSVLAGRTPPRPLAFEGAARRPLPRLALALLVVWFAVQVALPLRHHLYPGSVHWTEQGHRFAWHMKLRDKEVRYERFLAYDRAAGERWVVDPSDYLRARQRSKMAARPDMVLQFAHHVEAVHERRGGGDLELRAEVWVSLNGRAPQLMIDPAVDLTRQSRSLLHARWIRQLDAPTSAPVATR